MPGSRHRLARKRSYNGRERVYRRPIRRALTAAEHRIVIITDPRIPPFSVIFFFSGA